MAQPRRPCPLPRADQASAEVERQRTRQVEAPTPEPQRRLPSLNSVQKKPSLQSVSLSQTSHSSPSEHPTIGSAARTNRSNRDRRISSVPSLRKAIT